VLHQLMQLRRVRVCFLPARGHGATRGGRPRGLRGGPAVGPARQ
jgi:hypothetical protein